jgi:adenylate cyclase class 2
MPVEREIKLRFESADLAREQILSPGVGATPLRGRRLQEDCLLDTADDELYTRRCVLRVRSEGGKSLLTFKGPVQPGLMKVREEHETVVADGDALLTILRELGLHVWFRYEKYREEFSAEDVVIAVDETPVGTFVEIEGGEEHIHRIAAALGKTPADYITDSYRTLFAEYCREHGLTASAMTFSVSTPATAAAGTHVSE